MIVMVRSSVLHCVADPSSAGTAPGGGHLPVWLRHDGGRIRCLDAVPTVRLEGMGVAGCGRPVRDGDLALTVLFATAETHGSAELLSARGRAVVHGWHVDGHPYRRSGAAEPLCDPKR